MASFVLIKGNQDCGCSGQPLNPSGTPCAVCAPCGDRRHKILGLLSDRERVKFALYNDRGETVPNTISAIEAVAGTRGADVFGRSGRSPDIYAPD
jgi:hypothetical protein